MLPRTVLVVLLLSPSLLAWGKQGHMIGASIAYRQLTKEQQQYFTDILRDHPNYYAWSRDHERFDKDSDFGEFLFMGASLWPDEIRRSGNKYDHAHWHYVNFPLKPPGFAYVAERMPDDNALTGLDEAKDVLEDNDAGDEIKAVYLAWAIHIIADKHQPLHSVVLVNDTFPHGDTGGNDFFVKSDGRPVKLHAFWDALFGTSKRTRAAASEAISLTNDIPGSSLPELASAKTPRDWSLESRQVAIDEAYLKGELDGVVESEQWSAPPLRDGYPQRARYVANRRIVLAGHRLAGRLVDHGEM